VNFKVAAITELLPDAAGPFFPDAFIDTKDGRGITWRISHFANAASDWSRNHTVLTRFDCDLSLDVNDPSMKKHHVHFPVDVYFNHGLSKAQRERALEASRDLRGE
jgi:hypothetical protein